jgi:protein-disulfide isomerase
MRSWILTFFLLLFLGSIVWFGYQTRTKQDNVLSAEAEPTVLLPTQAKPTVTILDPVRGDPNASITIIEYGDYFCEFCRNMAPVIKEVLAEYPSQVRFVWKDFPNDFLHGQASRAAKAARCAGEQGAYWEYHDTLLARRDSAFSLIPYTDLAGTLALDTETFDLCMQGQAATAKVDYTQKEAQALELPGTPTFFINNQPFGGTSKEDFIQAIDTLL